MKLKWPVDGLHRSGVVDAVAGFVTHPNHGIVTAVRAGCSSVKLLIGNPGYILIPSIMRMLQFLPNQLVRWWFDGWCRRALRSHFCTVHQYGDRDWITRFDPQVPRLYVANHASFWDGIVCYHLLRQHLRQEQIMCLIDSVQMREHPFFGSVGGLAIDRSNPRRALEAIRAAAQRLSGLGGLPAGSDSTSGSAAIANRNRLPQDSRPSSADAGGARILAV